MHREDNPDQHTLKDVIKAPKPCMVNTRVLSGVPQGTVMGPLLFLIYINYLRSIVSPGTTARLFADGCLMYRDITCEEDQLTLQKDLAAFQDWAEIWGIRFNPKKCNILRISQRCHYDTTRGAANDDKSVKLTISSLQIKQLTRHQWTK